MVALKFKLSPHWFQSELLPQTKIEPRSYFCKDDKLCNVFLSDTQNFVKLTDHVFEQVLDKHLKSLIFNFLTANQTILLICTAIGSAKLIICLLVSVYLTLQRDG